MKKSFSNLANMIRAVLKYCTDNAAATASIADFATDKAAIDNKVVLIGQLDQVAQAPTSGVTLDTDALRLAAETIAFKCLNPLVRFAARSTPKNNTLLQKVQYSKSDLSRLKKEDIAPVCQTIHDEALTNVAAAGTGGYTLTDVTNLQTAINLYLLSIQDPREAVVYRSLAIEQMEALIRDIIDNDFKLGLDTMVNTLEDTNPNFVNGYYKSREISNLGTTHAKFRGSVRNPLGTLLPGVRVWITKTGFTEVIKETLTTPTGKFSINQVPADDYDLHFEFEGYQSFTESNIHVSAGKEITRNNILQFQTFYSILIPVGEFRVGLSPETPVWRPGITINLKNINPTTTPSTVSGYEAYSPTDPGPGSGDLALNSNQNMTIPNIPIASFKPYLSFANTGTSPVTIEITIL